MSSKSFPNERVRPLNESLVSKFLASLQNYVHLEPEEATDEGEVSKLAHSLLEDAWANNASDIHLDPEAGGMGVRLRVDGRLHDGTVLDTEIGARLLRYFKVMAKLDPVHPQVPVQGVLEYLLGSRQLSLRISSVPAIAGEKMTIRMLDPAALHRSVDALGLCEAGYSLVREWLNATRGMVLVVGAIGSGKTTTLYSLLEQLRNRQRSVITIEDPAEYHLEGTTQIEIEAKSGLDYPVALKAIVRLDPDYIMVGEMRDRESAHAVVDASTSGKVVMSTLHSRDAVGAITSLRNFGVKNYEISAALEFVVAQRLVRKLCTECREIKDTDEQERRWFDLLKQECPSQVWEPKGCDKCHGTGYQGRTGIFEVWRIDEPASELILRNTDERTMRRKIRASGVNSILQDGLAKVAAGVTSIAELRSAALLGLDEEMNDRPAT